jgi:hypothetical protein
MGCKRLSVSFNNKEDQSPITLSKNNHQCKQQQNKLINKKAQINYIKQIAIKLFLKTIHNIKHKVQ